MIPIFIRKVFDERFIIHRLKSTRFAAVMTVLFVVGWFYYDLFTTRIIRYDFMIILAVFAVAKIASMIFYRATN